MQVILLLMLGIILLIFCIVDLWHLKEILKAMRDMTYYLSNIEQYEHMKYQG